VCARNENGDKASFPVSENVHIHHILHSSTAPAPISEGITQKAHALAEQLADTLEVVGLLAVEFFLTEDDQLIVNEMAPRPHNSGHYTIDACHTSQFQQHIRAITGLPLGKTDTHTPAVMVNILGDLWSKTPPSWNHLFKNPSTQLHLYDKGEARKGRKMGHFTVLDKNLSHAQKEAEALFLELKA
jgi:5-(carboxyamino)imidazole ribonucleotide synthase